MRGCEREENSDQRRKTNDPLHGHPPFGNDGSPPAHFYPRPAGKSKDLARASRTV